MGEKKKAVSVQSGDDENDSTPEDNSTEATNGESSIDDIPHELSDSTTRSGSSIRSMRSPRNAIPGPSNSHMDATPGPLYSRIEVDAILAAISGSDHGPSVAAYGNVKKTVTKPTNNKSPNGTPSTVATESLNSTSVKSNSVVGECWMPVQHRSVTLSQMLKHIIEYSRQISFRSPEVLYKRGKCSWL